MGKRRTKKQKKKASARRSRVRPKRKRREIDFGYDVGLIKKDLKKTAIVSVLILALELMLYFFFVK